MAFLVLYGDVLLVSFAVQQYANPESLVSWESDSHLTYAAKMSVCSKRAGQFMFPVLI